MVADGGWVDGTVAARLSELVVVVGGRAGVLKEVWSAEVVQMREGEADSCSGGGGSQLGRVGWNGFLQASEGGCFASLG